MRGLYGRLDINITCLNLPLGQRTLEVEENRVVEVLSRSKHLNGSDRLATELEEFYLCYSGIPFSKLIAATRKTDG